jgi:hypothetical protein
MQARPLTASTKAALLVGFSIGIALLLAFSDLVSNAKYNERVASCKANLRVIGLAVESYQASHSAKMPATLKALQPILKSQSPFVCPLSPSEQTFPFRQSAYDYRFLSHPKGTDIICWDSHLHLPQHTIFVWLNRPNRNVLLADGQVLNMDEVRFQQLHLQGQTWIIQTRP